MTARGFQNAVTGIGLAGRLKWAMPTFLGARLITVSCTTLHVGQAADIGIDLTSLSQTRTGL